MSSTSQTFKVISSSSKGNAFIFGDLMIDCGVSYAVVKENVKKHVLLTHVHSDHLNINTVRKLTVNHDCKFYGIKEVVQALSRHGLECIELEFNKLYKIDDYTISPFIAYHDVENCGYRIMIDNYKHIHATDTATLEGITALNYDSASIECNHCELKALELIEQAKNDGDFTHLGGAMNTHLSVQQALDFVRKNNIKKLFPCHIGDSTKKEVLEQIEQFEKDRA